MNGILTFFTNNIPVLGDRVYIIVRAPAKPAGVWRAVLTDTGRDIYESFLKEDCEPSEEKASCVVEIDDIDGPEEWQGKEPMGLCEVYPYSPGVEAFLRYINEREKAEIEHRSEINNKLKELQRALVRSMTRELKT